MDLFDQSEHPTSPVIIKGDIEINSHWDEALNGFELTFPDGWLFYAPQFFEDSVGDRAMDYLLRCRNADWRTMDWRSVDATGLGEFEFENIRWQHDSLNMYGKTQYLPRFSAWHGDNDCPYTYSGIRLAPQPWNTCLAYIKQKVEAAAQNPFNSVLLNWYRGGDDHISWHTDAESELGKNPVVASVNFGQTRRFLLRRIDDHKTKLELPLGHGSLLVMAGALQHHWQHAVPKEKAADKSRINLTFRNILAR